MSKSVAELEAELAAARAVEETAAAAAREKALAVADADAAVRAKQQEIADRDEHIAGLLARADEARASRDVAAGELAALEAHAAALKA